MHNGTVINRNCLFYDPSVLSSLQFWQTDDCFWRSNWGPECENLRTCQFIFKGDFMWGHKLAWKSWNCKCFHFQASCASVSLYQQKCFLFLFFLLQTGTPQGTLVPSLPMRNRERLAHDIPQTCATHGGLVHACTHAWVRMHTRTPHTHTHTHMHVIMCSHMLWGSLSFQMLWLKILSLLLFKLTGSESFCFLFGFAYCPNLS